MTSKEENTILDEQLTEYTDQLLAGNTPQNVDNPELEAMTETVQRLHSAFREDAEIETVSKRVHAQVMAHWSNKQKVKALKHSNRSNWWRQISHQQMSLAVSLAVIILLVVAVPWLLTSPPSVPGAAGAIKSGTLLGIGIIILVVTVLILGLRNKK